MQKFISKILLTLLISIFFIFPVSTTFAATTDPGVSSLQGDLQIKKPIIEVNIPKLDFSNAAQNVDTEGYLHLPWVGEYIAAIYKFAMVIASILAVIIIILSGTRIIISAGGEEKNAATKRLTQAIIGLFICWGSYAILYNINPDLVNFQALKIKYIEPLPLGIELVGDAGYQSITNTPIPPKSEVMKTAISVAQNMGLDPCIIVTVLTFESGGHADAVNHNENWQAKNAVWDRAKFLMRGKTYKFTKGIGGSQFTPPFTNGKDYQSAIHNPLPFKNDDADSGPPPNYGMDWDFSHDIGLGQINVPAHSTCNGVAGKMANGKCYTVADLFVVEKNLEVSVGMLKTHFTNATNKISDPNDRVMATFHAYGWGNFNKWIGPGKNDYRPMNSDELKKDDIASTRFALYQKCKSDPSMISKLSASAPANAPRVTEAPKTEEEAQ